MAENHRAYAAPSGIGGWLIIPLLGLITTIILAGYTLWVSLNSFTYSQWITVIKTFTVLSNSMLSSIIFGFTSIITAMIILFLFLSRNYRTPNFFIGYLIYLAIVTIFDSVSIFYVSKTINAPEMMNGVRGSFIRVFISCAIWIPYFLYSERVKNTFIKR